MKQDDVIDHYKRAYIWMEHSNYSSELERVKNLKPEDITCQYFLSTYARVVLAAGFSAKNLDTLSPSLAKAFRNYNVEEIAGSPREVMRAALQIINRPDKIGAIVSMAKRLAREDWPAFKAA